MTPRRASTTALPFASLAVHVVDVSRFCVIAMILGQISWADCLVFVVFLIPQLLIHVGLLETAACGIKALPFLRRS